MIYNHDEQSRVSSWVTRVFGIDSLLSPRERALRVIEESVELSQAVGLSRHDIERIMDYVYSRPVGDVMQEAAGVGVTLLGLAECFGFHLNDVIQDEIERVESKPREHFLEKQKIKVSAGIKEVITEVA